MATKKLTRPGDIVAATVFAVLAPASVGVILASSAGGATPWGAPTVAWLVAVLLMFSPTPLSVPWSWFDKHQGSPWVPRLVAAAGWCAALSLAWPSLGVFPQTW